jgi:D-alanyl-lipoteichoic acid acyltransferase DltB (MBOAT superfamily)
VLGLQQTSLKTLIIPVGISFYTFQKVAFVIDTLALKQPMPKFLDFMNFAGFFPQIVAGPIERKNSLLPQMEAFQWRWDAVNINEGATWIALGFFFKCALADNLAACFDMSSETNAYLIWIANLIFGLRIYYDFAGYSLIAVGIARCLGVRLTLNFASPYCSTNITEFWRRWHITLSQWFRDYIYVPLGGGRVRWWFFNIGVVFLVSGIWHGAGWNFIIWGALHGIFLLVNRSTGNWKMPSFPAWMLTLFATFGAWLSFYEPRAGILLKKVAIIATPSSYKLANLQSALESIAPNTAGLMVGMLLLVGMVFIVEWFCLRNQGEAYKVFRNPAKAWVLVVLTVILAPGENNGFIYFAF